MTLKADLLRSPYVTFQDEHYSDLAKQAISLWRIDPLYTPFYHEVGLLLRSGLFPTSSKLLLETSSQYVTSGIARASKASSKITEIPRKGCDLPSLAWEIKNKAEALKAFPENSRKFLGEVVEGYGAGNGDKYGQKAYINPRAGWAEAGNATRACLKEAKRLGVKVYGDSEVASLILSEEKGSDGKLKVKGVRTTKGEQYFLTGKNNGNVILATGSWSKEIMSKLTSTSGFNESLRNEIATLAAPSAQCVLTLQIPKDQLSKFKNTPVVLNFRTGFYLFEPNENGIMKIAIHGEGYEEPKPSLGVVTASKIQPPSFPSASSSSTSSSSRSEIPSSKTQDMLKELYQIYPSLSKVPLKTLNVQSRICWYSDSQDENWLIDRHPSYSNLLISTGDSGHGFKFLPLLGDLLAARMGVQGFGKLSQHQEKVFGFQHHLEMARGGKIEKADSGRGRADGDGEDNLRARL